MKIGFFIKTKRPEFATKLREVVQWLQARQCEILAEEHAAVNYGLEDVRKLPDTEVADRSDAILVFGGDGTMLSVARLIRHNDAPILGVNLGSLGFLTAVTLDKLYPALERILAGEQKVTRRSLLRAEVHQRSGQVHVYHALNDIVLNKGALARIITMNALINDQYTATFLADGLIISTPTGSTAYSLSAGGPIIFPTLDSITITPICPHSLTNRPLLVHPDSRIRVILRSGEDVMLTVDGQIGLKFREGEEVVCTQSEFRIRLIQPNGQSFFDVLREKLKWGER